ncbi:MAG: hypothetical protein PHY12_05425 [Eubacteriales bacterium]|nr:hypothetical protein [Eubacteriales bacterium]
MKRRFLASLLCLCMLTVPALAENESVSARLRTLLFETSNVTATAHVEFRYDGELFKTLDATVKHDGTDWLQEVSLTTPANGSAAEYVGSYTIHGQGARSYSFESYNQNKYYSIASSRSSSSLVRASTLRTAGFDALAALADTLPIEETESGYHLALQSGDVSALTNSVLSYTALLELARRGYRYSPSSEACYTAYQNWDDCFKGWVATNNPTVLDLLSGYYTGTLDEKEQTLVGKAMNEFNRYYNAEADKHETGVLYVYPSGKTEWFETYNDYMRGTKQIEIRYEDFANSQLAYCNQRLGTSMSQAEFDTLRSSVQKGAEIETLCSQMEKDYREQALAQDGVVGVYVRTDGTLEMMTDLQKVQTLGQTVSNRILYSIASLGLDTAVLDVTKDEQGRLTGAKGEITLKVGDVYGDTHTLQIALNTTATDYGSTTFERFDPATSDIPSAEEYWNVQNN